MPVLAQSFANCFLLFVGTLKHFTDILSELTLLVCSIQYLLWRCRLSIICGICSSVKILHYTTRKGIFQSFLHGVSFPCRQPFFSFPVSESLTLSLPVSRTFIFCAPKPYWWHDNFIYWNFLYLETVYYFYTSVLCSIIADSRWNVDIMATPNSTNNRICYTTWTNLKRKRRQNDITGLNKWLMYEQKAGL
jgi:hypothetical protein